MKDIPSLCPGNRQVRQRRIVIVDGSRRMREFLRGFIEHSQGFRVIGEASQGKQGVQLAIQLRPEFVLMDVKMAFMDCIKATRIIKRCQPQIVVIGLSVCPTDQVSDLMADAGASAVL